MISAILFCKRGISSVSNQGFRRNHILFLGLRCGKANKVGQLTCQSSIDLIHQVIVHAKQVHIQAEEEDRLIFQYLGSKIPLLLRRYFLNCKIALLLLPPIHIIVSHWHHRRVLLTNVLFCQELVQQ